MWSYFIPSNLSSEWKWGVSHLQVQGQHSFDWQVKRSQKSNHFSNYTQKLFMILSFFRLFRGTVLQVFELPVFYIGEYSMLCRFYPVLPFFLWCYSTFLVSCNLWNLHITASETLAHCLLESTATVWAPGIPIQCNSKNENPVTRMKSKIPSGLDHSEKTGFTTQMWNKDYPSIR